MNFSVSYEPEGAAAAVYYIVCLVVGILSVVCQWRLFTKAGERGWKSLVPFYNSYILCRIVIGRGWVFVLSFIPIVNIIFVFILYMNFAKAYGKSGLYGILMLLLPIPFYFMLGFGSSYYVGPLGGRYTNNLNGGYNSYPQQYNQAMQNQQYNQYNQTMQNQQYNYQQYNNQQYNQPVQNQQYNNQPYNNQYDSLQPRQ